MKFIKYFILIVGRAFKCDSLSGTCSTLPLTLGAVRQQLGYSNDIYINYVHGGGTYSVGAICLTLQNLPRHIRYCQENIILLAIIPGPKEPKLHMNLYLTPLIEELHKLWNGVLLTAVLPCGEMPIRVRAALSCVVCDIPASRKVCGFLGHNAKLGCNKCLKVFTLRKNYQGKSVVALIERTGHYEIISNTGIGYCN